MNRRILLRDFLIANAAGIFGGGIMFAGIIMQERNVIPSYPCVFLHYTGLYCPGCGGSRALLAFLDGNFITSLIYNPAVVLGVLLILYYEVTVVMTIISDRNSVFFIKSPLPAYVYLVLILLYAVVRDILLITSGIDLISISVSK